jgi:UDP-glucose 4-epimerase
MKNVMIDGVSNPVAAQLAASLSQRQEIKRLIGAETAVSANWSEDVELIAMEPDHRRQLECLRDYEIDTVIQCGVAPDRLGVCHKPAPADVIGMMRLGAAIGHAKSPVKSWVVLSSSSVYPINSMRPLLNDEASRTLVDEAASDTSMIEAEDYASAIARRVPHLNVSILRLQELIGSGIRGPLSAHFEARRVPTAMGHDPVLQFLHIEDAVAAISFAAQVELAGVYNVASRDVIRLSDLLCMIGRESIWLPPVEAGAFVQVAESLGLPHFASGLLPRLRFGHAIDTRKLECAGFKPSADQTDCAELLRR